MHLTTLVGILERDQPGLETHASTRGTLAHLYADRATSLFELGRFDEARREAERALATAVGPLAIDLQRIITASP